MKLIGKAIFSFLTLNALASPGLAQGVAYDGSVPGGALTGPDFVVPQNAGVSAGGNLLHSFAQFNVGTGESVTFTGAGVSNILARITGGESSRINGLVRSSVPGAHLYLLNPSGVIMGEGARIDVSGSLNISTADYLKLADGRELRASMSGDLTLLSAAPEAFGFLNNPGGGDIKINRPGEEQTITFPGGKLVRAGALDSGDQIMRFVGRNILVEDSVLVSRGGDIILSGNGMGSGEILIQEPSVGNGEVTIRNTNVNVGWVDGGRILVRGSAVMIDGEKETQRVELDSGVVTSRSSDGMSANGRETGTAGQIDIRANGLLQIKDTRLHASGRDNSSAGNVLLEGGGGVEILDGAIVSADVQSLFGGDGEAGEVIITGKSLLVDGLDAAENTHLHANTSAGIAGGAGLVDVRVTDGITLQNGGNMSANSFGTGNAGSIVAQADNLLIRGGNSNAFTGMFAGALLDTGSGNGGVVDVDIAGNAMISNRGWVGAVTDGDGNSGRITFKSSTLTIRGGEDLGLYNNEFLTGIIGIPFSGTDAEGRGADIDVRVASTLRLERGGQIDSSTFGGGNAGNVYVEADVISADREGSLFFTGIGSDTDAGLGSGNAGSVTVKSSEITLSGGAHISSSTFGHGNAGDIAVSADKIMITGSGPISGFVPASESGIIALTRENSLGDGGDVTVRSPCVILDQGGIISAQSDGLGNGGIVTIDTANGKLSISNGARLSARSDVAGVSGGVVVRSGLIHLTNGGAIESLNLGSGTAGTVRLEATLGVEIDHGSVAVSALNADAGQLEFVLGGDLSIDNGLLTADAAGDGGELIFKGGRLIRAYDSQIRAEAVGNGGNVVVQGGQYLVFQESRISANAVNGDGGIIDFQTNIFFSDATSITAISQFGNDGTVSINPEISFSNNNDDLDSDPLDESDELEPECTQRLATKEGSFTQAGRGGSQRLPGGYLPSLRLFE